MREPPARTTRRNRIVVLLILLAAALAALKIDHRVWPMELFAQAVAEHFQRPNIAWKTASPAAEGMSARALDAMRRELARHGTSALLVVRGGRLVYEWYPLRIGPNQRHYTAALAKAVIGSMALLAALTEGRLRLDDPAWKYIPRWKNDPVRSRIRIRDLAFHTSGLADVD
ncbi:MAG TPA: class A beta-lactamase-related serine hydrolase, partial [Chromatiales bacterium]|nr:class A beta-lactamase-related serine hydrolase [Chromatiales bacterium]